MPKEIKNRYDLETKLVSLFNDSPELKDQFKNDPHSFIKGYLDFEISAEVKINVVEFDKNELVLSLPKQIATAELSDEELDSVAGGTIADDTGSVDCTNFGCDSVDKTRE